MKLAGRNFILVLCTMFGTIVESKLNRTKLKLIDQDGSDFQDVGAIGSKKHGLKNLINNEKLETYDNPKLKKLVNEIDKENIIEAIIDNGISKEKSKLATLEKVKHDHEEKISESKKIPDCPVYHSVIENGKNASVDFLNFRIVPAGLHASQC